MRFMLACIGGALWTAAWVVLCHAAVKWVDSEGCGAGVVWGLRVGLFCLMGWISGRWVGNWAYLMLGIVVVAQPVLLAYSLAAAGEIAEPSRSTGGAVTVGISCGLMVLMLPLPVAATWSGAKWRSRRKGGVQVSKGGGGSSQDDTLA